MKRTQTARVKPRQRTDRQQQQGILAKGRPQLAAQRLDVLFVRPRARMLAEICTSGDGTRGEEDAINKRVFFTPRGVCEYIASSRKEGRARILCNTSVLLTPATNLEVLESSSTAER